MIQLQRNLAIRTFDVEATVAFGRDRPELLAIARLARDLRRGIGGREVTRELLGGLPEHVGWRVIERCLDLGLLTRQGSSGPAELSEVGAQALEVGEVLVPEEGVWRFYLVDDPLLTIPVVHCERLAPPNADQERRELKSHPAPDRKRGRDPIPREHVPEDLRGLVRSGALATSLVTRHALQLRELAAQGAAGPAGELRLMATWSPDAAPTMTIRGQLAPPEDSHQRPDKKAKARSGLPVDSLVALPPNVSGVSHDELWFSLASFAGGVDLTEVRSWYSYAGGCVLPVTFQPLNEASRTTMRRDLPVPPVRLGQKLGDFEATTLADVKLVPRTDDDAQQWAEWLQIHDITDYVTPERLRRSATEIRERFPYHRVRLRSPETLLKVAQANPRHPGSRYLLAPHDLGLWSST